jgi:hypothetical protein
MEQLIIIIEDSKTLFCSSKFQWAGERISSKFIGNVGTRPQKRFASSALRSVKNLPALGNFVPDYVASISRTLYYTHSALWEP